MNKYARWLLIGDGVLFLYTFLYAYIFHFGIMLKVGSKFFHLSPITSFGILGIIFVYSGITGKTNVIGRVLSGISAFIAVLFIFIQGFTIASANGILAAAALPGFPFAGGLLIHVIFEHSLGGALGLILAIKPNLLLKRVIKVKRVRIICKKLSIS